MASCCRTAPSRRSIFLDIYKPPRVVLTSGGDIVGQCDDGPPLTTHGFLLRHGEFQTIDFPGAAITGVFGINNQGDMVGNIIDNAGINHGFLDQGGTFTRIDVPGAAQTFGFGINDVGEIVGSYVDMQGKQHGYLRTELGLFITIDVPGSTDTRLRGINDRGYITGQFTDGSGTHAFLLA